MVLLCLVLDLPTVQPPSLENLKQSLLQLANFYAISSSPFSSRSMQRPSRSLSDRIGLCYLIFNRSSCSNELKIAYQPRGSFSLRDFHHAVHKLPTDAFLPQLNCSDADVKLCRVLSEEVVYSWGGKDVMRKVIFISSSLVENVDSVLRKALMDAADKCITVDFVLLEQKSSHIADIADGVNNFLKQICDLENCSFQNCLSDEQVLSQLVKRWLLELKEDTEEPLQAHFIFKSNLLGSLNQISCTLSRSSCHIVDVFSPCKACRCHGMQVDDTIKNSTRKSSSCPVTDQDLDPSDLMENCVMVGEQSILFLPSFLCGMEIQKASPPIDFNVLERINLCSLSEGVITGVSYYVTPSANHEMDVPFDEFDKSELNPQLFKGLCSVLHSLDQGLVCSSDCDIESMRHGPLQYYYVLQPSDRGPMLLRRLAGSEEFLPVPHVTEITSSVRKEIEDSVQASLLMMELRDYNPRRHETGLHRTVSFLVKESLHLRSVPPNLPEANYESNSAQAHSPDMPLPSVIDIVEEEDTAELSPTVKEVGTAAHITEEWEQLIVDEIPKMHIPDSDSKPKSKQRVLLHGDSSTQLDAKTSKILERLEVPRQLKSKLVSPVMASKTTMDPNTPTKSPLIPFQPTTVVAQGSTFSQPMKPVFQRSKRKQR